MEPICGQLLVSSFGVIVRRDFENCSKNVWIAGNLEFSLWQSCLICRERQWNGKPKNNCSMTNCSIFDRSGVSRAARGIIFSHQVNWMNKVEIEWLLCAHGLPLIWSLSGTKSFEFVSVVGIFIRLWISYITSYFWSLKK